MSTSSSSSSLPGRRCDPGVGTRWQEQLQRFEPSGLSVAAFCAQYGLAVRSFYFWRCRLRGQPPTADQPQPATSCPSRSCPLPQPPPSNLPPFEVKSQP
jgi:hypothetical protein